MNIEIKKVKITVTVPSENTNDIILALGDAGAGVIGNYSYCSVTSKCVGTFMGNEESNPTIGEKNKFEHVDEDKIEMICDISILKNVLKKLRELHPYEEPAINIIPLIDEFDL